MITWLKSKLILIGLAAAVMALGMAGTTGMYLGYQLAIAEHAKDREALLASQLDTLKAKDETVQATIAASTNAIARFEEKLEDINKRQALFNGALQLELSKPGYADAVMPAAAAAAINKQRAEFNKRLKEGK